MQLQRKYAWLLTAPLAWASGCGVGPISGLAERDPVISLERPDPLVALRRTSTVESHGAEAGSVSTADWLAAGEDPEERRLVLLSGMRRRMSQQQQQMMMMMPLLTPQANAPNHQGISSGGPSSPSGPTAKGTKPNAAQPQMPLNPLLMPGALSPELLAEAGMPPRRATRGRGRSEPRIDREETAASTEADRIERAAKAEAERAEKAALAEATIAERRLLAEAELAERMTRAEVELAERLAAAKQERDLRISTAREERALRMAIIGIDPNDLGADPVDEALARIDPAKSRLDGDDSGLARFTRFFRSKSEAAAAGDPPRQTVTGNNESADALARNRATDSRDLIDRTLEHSDSLLDDPSIAEFASSIPGTTRTVARTDRPDGPSTARDFPASSDPSGDEYDSLLARESLDRDDRREPEDWSLLDDFLKPNAASDTVEESSANGAAAFPVAAAGDGPSADSSAFDFPATTGSLADADAPVSPTNDAARRSPEDDVWILGEQRDRSPTAEFDAMAASERPIPGQPSPIDSRAESFTRPAGLYARVSDLDSATSNLSNSEGGAAPGFPALAAGAGSTDGSLLEDALLPAAATDDPFINSSAATVAQATPADVPRFDWSQSGRDGVDRVTHQQPPAPQVAVRNAAWTSQSLRDVCGPLPADLDALVRQLDIPEAGVRKAVLADLAELGSKARPAVPAVRVLLDDSPLVAAHAAWTLWQIEANETQTVDDLVRLLQTGDPDTVQFTAYALGTLGPKALSAAPTLRAERERFSGATRVHVAEALTRIDAFDQASVEVLMYGLQHPETHVRWLSALSLGEVQVRYSDLVVPSLISALQDSDAEVRSAAALSIGGFGRAAQTAVPELQSRATLDAPSVREAAQTALACINQ